MNDAVVLSFTMYSRSPWSAGDAAVPSSIKVLKTPICRCQTTSPSMSRAVTRPMLPK